MDYWNITSRLYQSEPMERCRLHDCRAACCLYGVWLDIREAEEIRINAFRFIPHMLPGNHDPKKWFTGQEEADSFSRSGRVIHSTVVADSKHYGGTACIFLNDSHLCALQVAASVEGVHAWRYKPFYCILHPLDLDEDGQITLDETLLLVDEPGSCLRPASHLIPLLLTFEEELRYLAGDEQYERALSQTSSLTG